MLVVTKTSKTVKKLSYLYKENFLLYNFNEETSSFRLDFMYTHCKTRYDKSW